MFPRGPPLDNRLLTLFCYIFKKMFKTQCREHVSRHEFSMQTHVMEHEFGIGFKTILVQGLRVLDRAGARRRALGQPRVGAKRARRASVGGPRKRARAVSQVRRCQFQLLSLRSGVVKFNLLSTAPLFLF